MLLKKFTNVGFAGVEVVERKPFGVDDLIRYPLFAPDFIEFLRRVIPAHRHAGLVFSLVVTAWRPQLPSRTAHPHQGQEA